VTADLRTPLGVEIVKRLIKDAEIIIENYRKGTLNNGALAMIRSMQLTPS
jgi:formyl-CoA transferase